MLRDQIEIDHILEAMSAQRTNHTSAHSRGAVLDLFTDKRVRGPGGEKRTPRYICLGQAAGVS